MSILAAAILLGVSANAFHETFQRAAAAYEESRYADAVLAYEQLVGEGVHDPAVFYNLGNAYLRLGEHGMAIANYERALQENPGLASARTNRAFAVRTAEGNATPPRPPAWREAFLFWDTALSPSAARRLAIATWLLFWAALAARQLKRFPYARTLIAASAVAVLATAVSAWTKSNPLPLAVAIDERVPVRHGTSDTDGVRFTLRHGDRVVVETVRGDWMRVRATIEGTTDRGWAPVAALVEVGPPFRPASPARLERLARDSAPAGG